MAKIHRQITTGNTLEVRRWVSMCCKGRLGPMPMPVLVHSTRMNITFLYFSAWLITILLQMGGRWPWVAVDTWPWCILAQLRLIFFLFLCFFWNGFLLGLPMAARGPFPKPSSWASWVVKSRPNFSILLICLFKSSTMESSWPNFSARWIFFCRWSMAVCFNCSGESCGFGAGVGS